MAEDPIRLEIEDFDNRPGGFRIEDLAGIASGGEALKIAYRSQGGPDAGQPITTSTVFDGPAGTFDLALGTFDESGGNSRITVRVGGVQVADFRLDENPGGGSADASTRVVRAVASDLAIDVGDEIEITVYRDGGEYVRLDFLDLTPTGPATGPVGPVADTDGADNTISESAAAGTLVGIAAFADDPDAGDTVSYAVDDPRFTIDAAGVVRVAPGATFDAAGEPNIGIEVTATSTDTSTSSAVFTIAVTDEPPPPPPPTDPIRLEAEDFATIPGGLATVAIGAASSGEALQVKYNSQGGPGNNQPVTTSTTYNGPDGTFHVFLGAFDEDDGQSRIVVRIGGEQVADFRLDQDPGGEDPDETTAVRREVALALDIENGDLIEVTIYRNAGEYTRFDYIDLVPLAPPTDDYDVGPVADTDSAANEISETAVAGALVGITAFAEDQDAGDSVSYAIDDPRFSIDGNGVVRVAAGATFDADGEPTIEVEVTATSTDGSSSRQGFTIEVNDAPPPPAEPIRLEAEDFQTIPGGLATVSLAAASEGEALQVKYNSQGGPGNNQPVTTSTTYSGPDGQFDLFLGAFDEDDGQSRIVVRIGGDEVADILLDQDPDGPDPDASTHVRRQIATGLDVESGDLIEVTIFRNDGEYARFDFLELVPLGPPEPAQPPAAFQVSELDGNSGFRIDGLDGGDRFGSSVAIVGDVNNDGIDDFAVGAWRADPHDVDDAGEAYVVFGRDGLAGPTFPADLDLLSIDGANGFRIDGTTENSLAGFSLGNAGDINNDGIDDIAIGAVGSGAAFVVFGRDGPGGDGFATHLDLSDLDGTNGFRIDEPGTDDSAAFGTSVSGIGDINGDGFDDLAIAAGGEYPYSHLGTTFVLFGRDGPGGDGFAPQFNASTIAGASGFTIEGSSTWVSRAGDINGDGFDDLLVGTAYTQDNIEAGGAAVIFGRSGGFASTIELSSLDGTNGFRLQGEDHFERAGYTVSYAGDLNNDGIDDMIIGSFRDPQPVDFKAGESYVVFGQTGGFASNINLSELDGSNGFRLFGDAVHVYSGHAVSAAGDFNGDGIDDVVVAEFLDNHAYVLFGRDVPGGASFTADIRLSDLDSSEALRLDPIDGITFEEASVAGGGDINGDGFDDIIIGQGDVTVGGTFRVGQAHVIYGGPSGPGSIAPAYNLAPNIDEAHFGVDENSAPGTVVGTVPASDPDGLGLGFAIADGNHDGAFAIDGNGRLTVAGTIDHENGGGRVLTVEVADAEGYVSRATVTVAFRDQADGLFPSDGLDLTNLNGANGFRVIGQSDYDQVGLSVSGAGDVNGDGIDDLIVAASHRDDADRSLFTGAYVVFGQDTTGGTVFADTINVSTLDGSNGFRIEGEDAASRAVSGLGDVNGDGIDDILVGASGVDASGLNSGTGFVVFGSSGGFSASFDLTSLNGSNGFRLDGEAANDRAGWNVSGAGDVNGDGIQDLMIATLSNNLDGTGDVRENYVVFGSTAGFDPVISLSSLDGSHGFALLGLDDDNLSSWAVGDAGDVNNDGIDDLILGGAGSGHVLFGTTAGFSAEFDLASLDGSNGFRITRDGGSVGNSVSGAGDVNNDGIDDVILSSGDASFVVFGSSGGFSAEFDLADLDGTNGFRIEQGVLGGEVSAAGDVNGDGIDDVIVGSPSKDADGISLAGTSHVVFGRDVPGGDSFAASIDVASLDGTRGLRLDGTSIDDYSGRSVSSAGDINGDGFDDLAIGAEGVDYIGHSKVGAAYVVFGGPQLDRIAQGTSGDDLLVGGLGDDTLTGLTGSDWFAISAGDDVATDFVRGEDTVGLEGLLDGLPPGNLAGFVELITDGPDALFSFDRDGNGDFSATGREGTLTLAGVDLSGESLQDLVDDGTLWLG